jgi:4-hydroxy-2-oxoheptanedioate aldolase
VELPINAFKRAISEGRQQIGLWCTLSDAYALEIVAGSGFDWLLIDMEHSPNDLREVLSQLQVVSAYQVSSVVRPIWNDAVLVKRLLDIGAQSLLFPYVQDADEARRAVAAVRYPPVGLRGVSAVTRATRFGRVSKYPLTCETELCVLVQVETQKALENLDEIARVDGVDGVFVGPGDLAADLGYLGQPGHPEVQVKVESALRAIRRAGKPAGVLTGDPELARRCIDAGSVFTAVGVDAAILARKSEELSMHFFGSAS